MEHTEGRIRIILYVLTAALVLASLTGCATKSAVQSAAMTMSAGAGVGNCDYDPKDKNQFVGAVDSGDACIRVVGRVRMNQEVPERIIQEKGDPVIPVSSGPFGEIGYNDLGDTTFDGYWNDVSDTGTVSATAWHAAVGYTYPITRRLGLFARLGYAFWDVEEDEIYAGYPESHQASGSGPLYAAGLSIGLTRQWLLDVEWTRYQDVGEIGVTGEGDVDKMTATALYRFGR